ncbi:unnamed protein product [Gadus morhua 'NCC']
MASFDKVAPPTPPSCSPSNTTSPSWEWESVNECTADRGQWRVRTGEPMGEPPSLGELCPYRSLVPGVQTPAAVPLPGCGGTAHRSSSPPSTHGRPSSLLWRQSVLQAVWTDGHTDSGEIRRRKKMKKKRKIMEFVLEM